MKRTLTFLAVALLLAFVVVSCTTTEKGAVVGGALGAGTGAIIGHQTGSTAGGALIGGAVGAVGGGLIGHEIDESK
ncbi:cell envelope biogenesis protein OmpA [Candidatus Poribacteria bacterium]|nr:cell envelope biogenesis protein OmpA [Candidatus Poribacteria bacterium]